MKLPTCTAFKVAICYLVVGMSTAGLLLAAELSTDFPKDPPPLELAPRLGRPFGDNAVFQQQMPVPVWGWTLPDAQVEVTFDQQKHRRRKFFSVKSFKVFC